MDNNLRNDLITLKLYLLRRNNALKPGRINDTIYAISHLTNGTGSIVTRNGSVYINIPRRNKRWQIGELNTHNHNLYPHWGILPTYLHLRDLFGHDSAMEYVASHLLTL